MDRFPYQSFVCGSPFGAKDRLRNLIVTQPRCLLVSLRDDRHLVTADDDDGIPSIPHKAYGAYSEQPLGIT